MMVHFPAQKPGIDDIDNEVFELANRFELQDSLKLIIRQGLKDVDISDFCDLVCSNAHAMLQGE